MCGIVGAWALGGLDVTSGQAVQAMTDSLRHRGPDAGAVWRDDAAGVALGHRRLAVVDLSPAGAQPMVSASGRHVIVYNGEIYTADQIRRDLGGLAFRGHSDTEAILEACEAWGVEATLDRLIGMFAFALWDRVERRLTLVRDRLGIKPLYWSFQGGTLLFGSELKAFAAWPGFAPRIDRAALAEFFHHTYIPAPATIFQGVHKLMPGHVLTLGADGVPHSRAYWSLKDVAATQAGNRFDGDDTAMIDALDALLGDAVGKRMVADVSLGAFLSGGVDSSLVAALMQARSPRPVKTFTIAFDVPSFDESVHAAAVARHLGTDHHEMRVTAADALAVVPDLAQWYDEPFADSSAIPTYLVSAMARRHATVALSGDGGDELFAGYARYARVEELWRKIAPYPASLRRPMGRVLSFLGRSNPAGLMSRAGDILSAQDADALFRRIVAVWRHSDGLVPGAEPLATPFSQPDLKTALPGLLDRMLYLDSVTHLSDDILTKVDRTSMAVSLEVRVPVLDHRIAAFAFGISDRQRRADGRGKWPLREVLYRYVPRSLIDRPKMGFMVPVGAWLRGELREWAEDLLAPRALAEGGFLDEGLVRRRWEEHGSGRRDWTVHLWTVLMFQAWRRRWGY